MSRSYDRSTSGVSNGDPYAQRPSFAISQGDMFKYYSMTDLTHTTVDSVDLGDDELAPELMASASIASSVFTLSNTILGASTLTMAYACSEAGIIPFVLLLIVVGIMSNFSIQLLVRSMTLTGKRTYADVGQCAMGRAGSLMADVCVIVQQLGACIAYVKIVGDVIGPVVQHLQQAAPALASVALWQVAVVLLLIFPLCMLRRMDSLRYAALAALTLILCFVVVVVVDSIHIIGGGADAGEPPGSNIDNVEGGMLFGTGTGIVRALPVMAFAFVCHMNVFPIYSELKDASLPRMKLVGGFSSAICFTVYVLAGVMGYLAFRGRILDDLIKSYNAGHIWVSRPVLDVFQFGIGGALVLTFPVLSFELRHCMDSLVFGHQPFTWARHTGLNVVICGTALLVGILVPQVVTVFAFTGATTSSLVVFIMPPLFYILNDNEVPLRRSRTKQLALLQVIVGGLIMPISLVVLMTPQHVVNH